MDNPFKPSFGNRPDKVVGRDEVLDDIAQGLSDQPGSHRRATFVTGQRGTGKTALLLEIEAQAAAGHYVTARSIANESMTDSIIERLQLAGSSIVNDPKRPISGFSVGALGFSVGLTFTDEVQQNYGFETKLGMLCDRLADYNKGVLILVDEVRSSSKEMRLLASAYQNLVGDGRDIAICMAGLPSAISNVLNDDVLTFLNRANKIHLEPLMLPAVKQYYRETLDLCNRSISPASLEKAASVTKGFPYLLQLVGYLLIEETKDGDEITDSLVDIVASDAQEYLARNVFSPTLNALSPKDRDFLSAIAHEGDRASISSVEKRLNITNRYSQQYRKRLIDAGVVASPQRGMLEITVPYLAEYLRDREGA